VVILYILAQTVNLFLGLVSFAMLLRVLLSLFMPEDEGIIMGILVFITEIFVVPVRLILSRFRFVNETPIDISFMVAYFLLLLLRLVLPVPTL